MNPTPKSRIAELAGLFFKLGVIGFGGPAVHIAMMEEEVVERRKWMSKQDFLDMLGATNLIPGPNSTEMAIHIGHQRAGWRGLAVAGMAFVLPAVAITLALAWAYEQYGTLPQAGPVIAGIRPVVVAIVFAALWKLAGKALKTKTLGAIAAAVAVATLLGAHQILALLAGGVVGLMVAPRPPRDAARGDDAGGATPPADPPANAPPAASSRSEPRGGATPPADPPAGVTSLLAPGALTAALPALAAFGAAPVGQLFLYFLTVGSFLYGSGYVLFAFLEGGLVNDFGWLTQQQLIDSIAIGQFTPGPVLSTATFVGYLAAGPAGAGAATLGIFLPSFVLVALLVKVLPWMKSNPWLRTFLDGVNASAVALMVVVTLRLALASLVDARTIGLALAAAVLLLWLRANAAALVLGGAVAGYFLLAG